MKREIIMQNELINQGGWGSTFLALFMGGAEWITNLNINQYLTVIVSVFSIVFLVMKMYDQYIITKERKRKIKSDEH